MLKVSLNLAMITALSLGANAAQAATDAMGGTLTGNIGVASQYILRGISQTYNATYDKSGPETTGPAVQGGLDYTTKDGFYAGYWFSNIRYSYADLNPKNTKPHTNSVENDFYAGYNGKYGDFGYILGGTIYYYQPGWESLGFETKLGLTYQDLTLTAQTLLNDVTYGNKGDTYFLLAYSTKMPRDFTLTGQLGAYMYKKDGKFIGQYVKDASGNLIAEGKSAAFRHATIGVSHPLAATGATWGLQYIIGGDNRYGLKQDNALVGTVTLTF